MSDREGQAFGLLPDHLPFVITRFDRERRHLYINNAITRFVGMAPEAFIGRSNEELGMPPELVSQWNAALDRALAGTPTQISFEWASEAGPRTFEAELVPEVQADGTIETVIGITRDVTDERRAQRQLAAAAEQRMQALAQERHWLAALVAESPAAVSVVRGPEFVIELLNPRARALWGRADEVIGKPLLEALPELRGQGFEALLQGVVASGTPFHGEEMPVRIARPGSGTLQTHYFDFVYAPLRDHDGIVDGIIVHAHDVTEKRLTRERMRLATETTGVGIWEWNVATDEVRWDHQMRVLYGLPPDSPVTYETWRAAVLPEDLPLQEAILHDTVRRAGQSTREFRIRRYDDGRVRDIACVESVRVDAAGRPEWVVGTNLDVTERRHAERAVRESEARFRAMADHVPQLAWMADASGYLDWFNRRWLEFTGTRLEDNVGDGWKQVHDPAHVTAVAEKFERHLREGKDWEDTFPLRDRDGTYRWFLSRMNAIRDAAGNVVRFFGTNTDVTEQREMSERLRRVTTELAEVDRRKDEFIATLAHELRNPLASLGNGIAVLLTAPGPETAARTIERMERQFGHLVRLVDDLLDLSRVRSGKVTLAREALDVRELVEIAIEATRPIIDGSGHALRLERTGEPLVVSGDRTRLVQVFANLLTNAAKYSEPGRRITTQIARADGFAVVRVVDEGVGIAPEMIPTLWDMFTQVRDTLDKAQGGLGIGLSLARRLVELHGGTITAASAGVGHGSTFEVRLPLAAPATATAPPPAETSAAPGVARRILVVDDNVDAAEMLAMLLETQGHETRQAHDGSAALEAVRDFRPDIVLLDIGLPQMDGHAVARQLRADPPDPVPVLIALTGWGTAADQQRSREAGFDAHLTKPVRLDVLEELLEQYGAAPRRGPGRQ